MTSQERWTVLLLAGSRPGGDPLTRSLHVDCKPLLPIAGEPMVLRPVRALLATQKVSLIRVLTQQVERLREVLPDDPRLVVERSDDTIAATLQRLCADPATPYPLLVTTADHALLTPQMIEEFIAGSAGSDVAIGFVSRSNMLTRFPDAQRTWLRFGAERYSGANLFALRTPEARIGIERWRSVEQDRKKGWRVLLQMGLPLFLGAVLRVRDLHQSARGLSRSLGITIKGVVLSDPTAAIDVDKAADYTLVNAIIAGRA
ncbi:NTP transferase domain-containing protein [Sphingomonas sp. LHG3443-2]|uniref:NTP transferase domain-containing protein n=1 Tax=Sphingomonas sp. LHG3443-2 TaxID=2804639 RepID=UPI003CF6C468